MKPAMQNFSYYNPVKVIFGKGQIAKLATEIPKDKRILITYGGGSIKSNGVYDQVINALADNKVFEFSGIEPNPKYETLMKAVDMVRENDIDFLLAVGGGSVIDGTKFIAAAVDYIGEPWEMLLDRAPGAHISFAPKLKSALPFAVVLTLPAAGSEMNCGAVISRATSEDKLPFANPLVFPKFSILDPEVTFSLPKNQTANGIVDAYIHVVEQYLTFSVHAPLQDRVAEGIMLSLLEDAATVLQNPTDYNARANIMWCSTLALNGLIACGVPQDWATHMIGHELTAKFGLDHGQTLAIILPALMHVKRKEKHTKILQYAERIFNITSGSDDEKIDQAIAKTREFFESLGIKTRLSAYNITANDIPDILAQLEKHGLIAMGELQDIDLAVSEKILQDSL